MALRIVYLFGAGATHAEKALSYKIAGKVLNANNGLLARYVSKRVIRNLSGGKSSILEKYGVTKFSRDEFRLLWGENPLIDVELFISLLENLRTSKAEKDVRILRDSFKKDICKNLFVERQQISPRLYSALIELHGINKSKETLLGFLTLNYDSVLEKAFVAVKKKFDYGFDIKLDEPFSIKDNAGEDNHILLKLHGSFNWCFDDDKTDTIKAGNECSKEALWIPPSTNKLYLDYPYNIIHGKAYELLSKCDILRVVGCSLNQNDIGLISLLFRTQKLRQSNPYSIELITKDESARNIAKRLAMLCPFKESLYKKEEGKEVSMNQDNPFLEWLYYNVKTYSINTSGTHCLKDIKKWAEL